MEGRLTARSTLARSAAVSVVALVAGVIAVLLPEIAIVSLVAALGPAAAFVVITALSAGLALLVGYAFDAGTGGDALPTFIVRVRAWIDRNRAAAERRSRRLAHLSETAAFVALSITAGPLLTALALKLRGGDPRTHRRLAVASGALFAAVWVIVYAGGLAAVRAAL